MENNGIKFVEIPEKKFYLEGDSDSIPFLHVNQLTKIWKKYHYMNTNTPAGSPNVFEQERAITAENFIQKSSFKGGTIPPKGSMEGYLAFEYPKSPPSGFNLYVKDIQIGRKTINFNFKFRAKK